MSEFYRFLRPVRFNTQRSVIEAMPHGGVCIHARAFNMWSGDKQLFVGISVCPNTELFSRAMAKKKAEQFDFYVQPKSFSANDIIDALLAKPQEAVLMFAAIEPSDFLWESLNEFKSAVAWIRETKKQAKEFEKNHRDAVAALQLGDRYNDLQS